MSQSPTARATVTVAVLLSLSRLGGFVRSQAIAAYYGATGETDAFMVALSVATLVTAVTGPITVTFLPVYAAAFARGERVAASRLASYVISLSSILMICSCICLFAYAPYLTRLFAPGFRKEIYERAVSLVRLMAPFMILPLLASLAKVMLNTRGQFAVPAGADVVENVSVIVSIAVLAPSLGIEALPVSVSIGFVFLFAIQYAALKRTACWPPFAIGFDGNMRRVLLLAVPIMVSSFLAGIHHFVDKALASKLSEGSVAILEYAERIRGLPMGILVAAVATVVSPALSGMWGRGDQKGFAGKVVSSIRAVEFFCIPASAILMVLAQPIVRLVFQRGAFTPEATVATARALIAYAPGLFAIAGLRMLFISFTAAQKTDFAVLIGIVLSVCNVLLDMSLIGPMGFVGLALANSLSAYAALAFGFALFRRKIGVEGSFDAVSLGSSFLKVVVASTVMAGVALGMSQGLGLSAGTGNALSDITGLCVTGLVSLGVFLVSAVALRCEELDIVMKTFRTKR